MGSNRGSRARAREVSGLSLPSLEIVCVPLIYMSGVKDESWGCILVEQEVIGATLWPCRTIIRGFLDKPVIQTWRTWWYITDNEEKKRFKPGLNPRPVPRKSGTLPLTPRRLFSKGQNLPFEPQPPGKSQIFSRGGTFVVCGPAHVVGVIAVPHLLILCAYHRCACSVWKSGHESAYSRHRSYPA